jgi:23S rRNA (uracil1939-C5)-methyltransferase
MALVVETVLRHAALSGQEMVLDLYSGIGVLTAFLAEKAQAVIAVEVNSDAVADTAVNLAESENVSIYEGAVEEVLPQLDIQPDVIVLNPTNQGITREATTMILEKRPSKIIYVSSDVATFARDGRKITFAGYELKEIQPIDMRPQTFHIDLVAVWELKVENLTR